MFEDATAKKMYGFFIHKRCIVLAVVRYECFWFFGRFIRSSTPSQELHDQSVSLVSCTWRWLRKNFKGGFWGFFLFLCVIQHCVVCHPSESAVSEDAGSVAGINYPAQRDKTNKTFRKMHQKRNIFKQSIYHEVNGEMIQIH